MAGGRTGDVSGFVLPLSPRGASIAVRAVRWCTGPGPARRKAHRRRGSRCPCAHRLHAVDVGRAARAGPPSPSSVPPPESSPRPARARRARSRLDTRDADGEAVSTFASMADESRGRVNDEGMGEGGADYPYPAAGASGGCHVLRITRQMPVGWPSGDHHEADEAAFTGRAGACDDGAEIHFGIPYLTPD